MSMLSMQCDELRDAARGQKAMGLFELAQMLKDAADTIWELRGMVHKERAEADRLREELEAVGTAAYLYGRDDLKAENAKLRELVLHMYACMGNVDADGNHECFSCEYEGAECDFADRMRELEVNDG